LAALLNWKRGENIFVSQKRSHQTVKNTIPLSPSKISSGKGNLKAPIVSSPKAKGTGVTAVPKQRETRPQQIIPMEDDFKEF